ncbi:protein-L-isoaspartate methyltransferase [Cutibacterium acnes JCM 18918]|nr:protein-L-isoaspartate methyltransferase [Cutibacterium acnes JCM 18918]
MHRRLRHPSPGGKLFQCQVRRTPRPPTVFFAAVLWDFDGTLVDTESRWVEAELAILASHGIVWEPEQANEFTGGPLTDVCEAMAADLGGSVTVDDVRCELITMVSQFNRERDVPWRPGVLDLLTEIREAGIPMGIVTGSAHAVVEPVLEAMAERIGNPFDTVVTFDDVIPETAKPAPDPYLLAAERSVSVLLIAWPSRTPRRATSATSAGAAVLTVTGLAKVGPGPRRSSSRPVRFVVG